MRLAKKLQKLREEKGLSQAELAQELFTSESKVASWESGDKVPEIGYIAKLAVFYDVPADELTDDDTPDPEEEANDAEAKKAKRKKINLIYWLVWAVIYLAVSLVTGKWGASWTLLLLGGAIWLIALAFRWVNATK